MDKVIILDFLKKHGWKISTVVLAIILLMQCGNSEPQIAIHKDKAKEHLTIARKEVDKTDDIIADYEKQILAKDKLLSDYKLKLANSQKQVKAKLSDLKQYKNSNIVIYYKDRYNVTDGLKSIDTNTIAVKDDVSKLIISDLIKYDGLKYDVPILKSELNTVNDKFLIANTTIDTLKISINSISKAYENANTENQLAIKEVEKSLKKEKLKKNVWKFVAIGSGLFFGYLQMK